MAYYNENGKSYAINGYARLYTLHLVQFHSDFVVDIINRGVFMSCIASHIKSIEPMVLPKYRQLINENEDYHNVVKLGYDDMAKSMEKSIYAKAEEIIYKNMLFRSIPENSSQEDEEKHNDFINILKDWIYEKSLSTDDDSESILTDIFVNYKREDF